jgi:hypothetical protein
MRILYKPFALIGGIISARLGKSLFKTLWAKLDEREPPSPERPDGSLTKVVTAAALEAATMAGVAAAVDRASARAFHHLTGIWPGKKKDDEQPES